MHVNGTDFSVCIILYVKLYWSQPYDIILKFYFAPGFLGVCHHSESLDDIKSILTEICPEFGCMHDCGQGCNNWGFSHIIYQALSKPSDEKKEKEKLTRDSCNK